MSSWVKKRFPGREIKTKNLDRKETTYDQYVWKNPIPGILNIQIYLIFLGNICQYHLHIPDAKAEANKTFIRSLHLSNGIKIQVHVCLTLNYILFIHSFIHWFTHSLTHSIHFICSHKHEFLEQDRYLLILNRWVIMYRYINKWANE